MKTVRTPNVATLTEINVRVSPNSWEMLTIPANTYLKPVELVYIPKHVQDDPRWKGFDPKTEVFCFTKWGMFPIARKSLKDI